MTASLEDVADRTFDFVIAGGGTAGLCLAARLSEDPTVSVLVLEAGDCNLQDPNLSRLGEYGKNFGNDAYDWNFKTTAQKHANGMEYVWNRGKGLGGTSGLNFMIWTKPPAEDINDWERLGNPGWNWDKYLQYSHKAENFIHPTEEAQEKYGYNCDGWTTASDGPLTVAYPSTLLDIEVKVHETMVNMGIPIAPDPLGGNPLGTHYSPSTIDPKTHTRMYAANAYYTPNASRPNLTVLVSAYANRILTNVDTVAGLTATGVEFSYHGGTYVAHARKEVVLCAGALKSPQILELSGIGRRDVLEPLGIPVKLESNHVGENLQEHVFIGTSFEIPQNVPGDTFDILFDPVVAEKHLQLHASGTGLHTMGITLVSFCPLEAYSPRAGEIFENLKESRQDASSYPPGLSEQYQILIERLEKRAAAAEIISFPGLLTFRNPPEPGQRYISFIAALNHPFSRGNVHVTSADPQVDPAFDPHYFEEDTDLDTLVETLKFARNLPAHSPLKEMLGFPAKELNPGPDIVTDEQLREYVKDFGRTTYHTIGTLSMLPRDKGGVVDPALKVYGTSNIRVVDLSIVPIHFASHSQATAYSIAEQAADIIKGIIPKGRA